MLLTIIYYTTRTAQAHLCESQNGAEQFVVLVIGFGVELNAEHLLTVFQRLDGAVVRPARDGQRPGWVRDAVVVHRRAQDCLLSRQTFEAAAGRYMDGMLEAVDIVPRDMAVPVAVHGFGEHIALFFICSNSASSGPSQPRRSASSATRK